MLKNVDLRQLTPQISNASVATSVAACTEEGFPSSFMRIAVATRTPAQSKRASGLVPSWCPLGALFVPSAYLPNPLPRAADSIQKHFSI